MSADGDPTADELGDVEFTHEWYRALLERLLSEGYRFRTYRNPLADGDVVLRHDVDLSPSLAAEMGRIEADLGVTSTYFFLLGSSLYNPFGRHTRAVVEELESLGHDVGLHFSTHEYWDEADPPAEPELVERVEAERAALDAVVDDQSPAISFHVPPDWVLEETFEGVTSAYEPRYLAEIAYHADSGQRWRDEFTLLADSPERVQILTHPGLWGPADASFEERVEAAISAGAERLEADAREQYLGE